MPGRPPQLRGVWRDDAAACAVYAEAAGIHRIVPVAVAVAADATDVERVVRWCAGEGVPVTPRGSGSSMAGGAVGPGVVLDCSRLNRVDPPFDGRAALVAGPGALCADVDAAGAARGLRFPLDPSSARFCTVGGMAATNAAGARTLRYGAMRAWVTGLECVFADGARAWVRRGEPSPAVAALARLNAIAAALNTGEAAEPSVRTGVRKESSGYGLAAWVSSHDVVDLLVGSEGTLAVFTAVEVALSPIPEGRATVIASFAELDAAAAAAAVASANGASACELLDATFLAIARHGGAIPVPDGAEAVLLIEIEGESAAVASERAAELARALAGHGAMHVEATADPQHAARLWHLRHAASPVLAAMSRAHVSMQIIEDGAVPPARLPEYIRALRGLFDSHNFQGVIFGHAGDGHVHANVLVNTANHDWRSRLQQLFDDATATIVRLGGSLAGEHGDGRLRADALTRTWPAGSVARFRAVKQAFDPHGVLNPGVKLPAAGAASFGAPIKYDPALDPLPEPAARVLANIQRDRAWHRARLELLDAETGH